MTKAEIRKKYSDIRKHTEPSKVTEAIYETQYYINAEKIFTFVSFKDEIDTIPFIKISPKCVDKQ